MNGGGYEVLRMMVVEDSIALEGQAMFDHIGASLATPGGWSYPKYPYVLLTALNYRDKIFTVRSIIRVYQEGRRALMMCTSYY